MASAAITLPLLESLIEKLGSAIWNELGLLWGVKDDIRKLQGLLSTIGAVLEDAERRSISDGALRKWLKDLKDAAFDADDVLDEFQTEAMRRTEDTQKAMSREVRRFFSSGNSVAFRFKMAHKIRELLKRFDEIAEEKAKFHLSERNIIVRHQERETCSYNIEHEIFGRKDDKEKIMKWLIERNNDQDISVLPVIGLGGLGKTTLAQLVYNDEEVERHFDIQMWVFVGEDFDVNGIVKAIIEGATREHCMFSRLQDMQQLLREGLGNKRYLLVLDDVWSEDASRWETLKILLRGRAKGNKIVLTTRSQRVAEIMGTVPSYKLEVLSDDDCWMLFKQRAFGSGREEETPKLVHIGNDIVKKCGGLPLAAKSLGSLMATKRGEAEWLAVRNSEIWRIEEGTGGILPALHLSYDHLPSRLKQCFSYCSIFPKDYKIIKLKLIQLWIAEGFIQSTEDMHAEDIGNQYFNNLLWRSFFQDEEKDILGNITSCKVHDLVHDLARFVAKDESCIVEVDETIIPHGCRYSSVICHDGSSSTIVKVVHEAKKLRSFFLLGVGEYYSTDCRGELLAADAISNLTHLRALYFNYVDITTIPSTVGKLKHLRFLDLSGTKIQTLPDSITNLYNLQALNLRSCRKLEKLPESIRRMSNLRHLDLRFCFKLTWMPPGLGRLTNLQTLPRFCVGGEPGHGTIAELRHLNQIRGRLQIYDLHNVKDPKDAVEAKLSSKTGIQSLELKWSRHEGESQKSVVDVLENLQPHPNLKYLEIEGYNGNKFPNWLTKNVDLSSSFCNLVELSIYSVKICESLPPLGQLPSLKHLSIMEMHAIKKIGKEFYGESGTFSSLKRLKLGSAHNLEEWFIPNGDMFPSLETMHLGDCPKVRIQPCMPSSIVELEVAISNEELLVAGGCLNGLSNLRKLEIHGIKASKTGWKGLQHLTTLQELIIMECSDLTCLPEGIVKHHCFSLRTLELRFNDNLTSIGKGEQEHQPPHLFASLHHLAIFDCYRLTVLPEWMRGLSSLQSLKLESCYNLKMLPDGLQHLTGLKALEIRDCPVLEGRCKRQTGEDWHKISHIPNITIRSLSLSFSLSLALVI